MTQPVWFSIEVFDGPFAASLWADAHGDNLVETALRGGALDWEWHRTRWGVVFEVAFDDEVSWEIFRQTLAVQAALDAVPDPVAGLIVYKGRGGSSGKRHPRKPRPLIGSGSAALPMPDVFDQAVFSAPPLEQRVLVAAG